MAVPPLPLCRDREMKRAADASLCGPAALGLHLCKGRHGRKRSGLNNVNFAT